MKNILIVEDEYFLADDCARVIEATGLHALGPFGTLADAEPYVAEADGAVLDVNLAGEMVFPLLEKLLAAGKPVALLTGYDSTSIPSRFASLPIFVKPGDCAPAVELIAHELGMSCVSGKRQVTSDLPPAAALSGKCPETDRRSPRPQPRR
ncbi:response regulator [Bradyrhizobium yuanmingense]|uniref:response regulator n=1 Tax=Bradyrhizobium yuanmingense TaxID=108015 RepID=UPI001CD787C3|nr:response regulator [Bradyrhizobium yuanmingense]MCA1529053.1 response regulator [Bradyrhizobium yuanmingense]